MRARRAASGSEPLADACRLSTAVCKTGGRFGGNAPVTDAIRIRMPSSSASRRHTSLLGVVPCKVAQDALDFVPLAQVDLDVEREPQEVAFRSSAAKRS